MPQNLTPTLDRANCVPVYVIDAYDDTDVIVYSDVAGDAYGWCVVSNGRVVLESEQVCGSRALAFRDAMVAVIDGIW